MAGTEMFMCLAMIALPQCMSKIMQPKGIFPYVKYGQRCLDGHLWHQ
jgi:hypothetical protein